MWLWPSHYTQFGAFLLNQPDMLVDGCVCFIPRTYTELLEHHKRSKKPSNSGAISAVW